MPAFSRPMTVFCRSSIFFLVILGSIALAKYLTPMSPLSILTLSTPSGVLKEPSVKVSRCHLP